VIGGFQTDHAYKLSVPEPYKVLVTGILDALGKELQDFGAALPITVMFTGAAIPNDDQGTGSKMALDHFIAFRGTQHDRGGEGGLDDNLCVFQNFACGTHFYIPNEFNPCLVNPKPAPSKVRDHQVETGLPGKFL